MKYIAKHKFMTTCIVAAFCVSACATAPTPVASMPAEMVVTESESQQPASLTVTVSGLEKIEGAVALALFDESGYTSGGPIQGQRVDVTSQTVTLVFDDVPTGEYGIKLFHDVDNNGEMNTNPFGIPTEPFAFSNSAKGTMGSAKWEQAKFAVSAGSNSHAISMK